MLARIGGFRDRPIKWWQSNFAQMTPFATVTKIYRILTKIWYKFACRGDIVVVAQQKLYSE